MSEERDRLAGDYYNSNPVSGANPGGMGGGGHTTNFKRALNDLVVVADEAAASADAALGHETQAGIYKDQAAGFASEAAGHRDDAFGHETTAGQHAADALAYKDAAEDARDAAQQAAAEAANTTGFDPNNRSITGAGFAIGGGDLTENRVITVPEVSQADAETGLAGAEGGAMSARRGAQQIARLANPGPVLFGGGGDGDVTVTGTVILTRDMFYRNLSFGPAGSIIVNGYRVFVSEELDLRNAPAGAIKADPANTTAGSVGTGRARVANIAGPAGQNGGRGGAGGGGAQGGGSGFAGGAGKVSTAPDTTAAVRQLVRPQLTLNDLSSTLFTGGSAGGDGGEGGRYDSEFGVQQPPGTGGNGGGIVAVFARTVRRDGTTAAGAISAKGQNATDGGNHVVGLGGAGGGGGGGGGGQVIVVCRDRIGATAPNALDVSGGNGGAGGAGAGGGFAGVGGGSGAGGRVTVTELKAASHVDTLSGAASVAGGAPVGAVGGAAGIATLARFDL